MKKITLLMSAGVALLLAIFSYSSIQPELTRQLSYLTIGIDQTDLSPDRSLHDIQRAEEHFSDMVLAWTVAPDFKQDLAEIHGETVSYTGRRQEKQNLLFSAETENLDFPAQFEQLVAERIQEYNDHTDSTFVIARSAHNTVVDMQSPLRMSIGVFVLAFGAALLIFVFIPLLNENRR